MRLIPRSRDPEAVALRSLERAVRALPARRRPDQSLQVVVDLARELSRARYAALAITDEHDRTQGFMVSGLAEDEMRGLSTPPQGHGPLASLRADGRPVQIDDVQSHAHHFGFPSRHPQMDRLLGVPIWAEGVVRGSLYVTDRSDGQRFDDRDEATLLTLARHATRVVEEEWY